MWLIQHLKNLEAPDRVPVQFEADFVERPKRQSCPIAGHSWLMTQKRRRRSIESIAIKTISDYDCYCCCSSGQTMITKWQPRTKTYHQGLRELKLAVRCRQWQVELSWSFYQSIEIQSQDSDNDPQHSKTKQTCTSNRTRQLSNGRLITSAQSATGWDIILSKAFKALN